MARAVVIQPPLLVSRDFIDYPYLASLGAYHAAGVLQAEGWEVRVLDGFDQPDADLVALDAAAWLGEPRERYLARLGEIDADLLVVSATPFLLGPPGSAWLAELVAALPDDPAVVRVLAEMYVGGQHYLSVPGETWLEQLPALDLVLRFEGEELLRRLCALLDAGERPAREVWENRDPFPLDALPAPAFDRMDADGYFAFLERVLTSSWRRSPMPAEPRRTLPLVTARGCRFGCIFCARNPGLPAPRRQYRAVPWPRVASWIEGWVRTIGIERLVILDELANLDAARFDSLLALLERHDLAVDFPNGLRADRLAEAQVRRLAHRTTRLKVSLESASPRVQREVLGKRLDPAAVENVARWCARAALPLDVHYLIGIPGERRDEVDQTVEMAARLHARYGVRPRLQFATPLPGTELERICREQDLLVDAPAELHECFQRRPLIQTAEFTPDDLLAAAAELERRLRPAEPKSSARLARALSTCGQGMDARQLIVAAGQTEAALGRTASWRGGPVTVHLLDTPAGPIVAEAIRRVGATFGSAAELVPHLERALVQQPWDGRVPVAPPGAPATRLVHLADAAAARRFLEGEGGPLPEGVALAEACRWSNRPCPARELRLIALGSDGSLRTCPSCPDLRRAASRGLPHAVLRRRYQQITLRRRCATCPVRADCPRCLFTGRIGEDVFCALRRASAKRS